MPELPDRIDGEIIEAAHMNEATIRSVQRYADEAERDALNPAPETGQPAWIIDIAQLQFWDGTEWAPVLMTPGGTMTGPIVIEVLIGNPDLDFRNSANQSMMAYNAAEDLWMISRDLRFTSDGNRVLEWRDVSGGTAGRFAIFRDNTAKTFHLYSTDAGYDGFRIDKISGAYYSSMPLAFQRTTGSAANMTIFDPGQVFRSTAARKYATNIVEADYLADLELQPVTFHHEDGNDYVGFIADDVAEVEPMAAMYGEGGELDNYDLRTVVAVLAAKVNRLEARVAALEA